MTEPGLRDLIARAESALLGSEEERAAFQESLFPARELAVSSDTTLDDAIYLRTLFGRLGMNDWSELRLSLADARFTDQGDAAEVYSAHAVSAGVWGDRGSASTRFEDALAAVGVGTPAALSFTILANLAREELHAGRIASAARRIEQADELRMPTRSAAVDVAAAAVRVDLARLAGNRLELRAAVEQSAQASRLRIAELGDHHPLAFVVLGNQAGAELALARAERDVEAFARVVGVLEVVSLRVSAAFGGDDPHALAVAGRCASAQVELAVWEGSKVALEGGVDAIEIVHARARAALGENHWLVAVLEANRAAALFEAAREQRSAAAHANALAALESCYPLACRVMGEHHPQTLVVLANLMSARWEGARSQDDRARIAEVEQELAAAAERLAQTLGEHHPMTRVVAGQLRVCRQHGRGERGGPTGGTALLTRVVVGTSQEGDPDYVSFDDAAVLLRTGRGSTGDAGEEHAARAIRPRYRRRSPSNRRNALIDFAQVMFEAQGYHETTVPNIAVRARVPVGSVYEYFMDKTALYLAVLDKQWDEFISGMHEALASTTDAAQRLRAVVEEYFVQVERRNTTLLFDRQVSDVAEVRERLDRFTSEWADVIKDVVATDHDLSDEAAKLVAVGVAGATQAVGRSWLSDEACVPRSEIVRTVMDLVLHGIVSWTPPNTPPSQSPPSPH